MKRIFTALLLVLLLASPALAAGVGQSQLLLKASDDDGYTCLSVSLGSYAADTMRQAAGTDFALLPSGLLGLNLQAGPVDDEALALSFPKDEPVYVVTLTPAQLGEILEHACSRLAIDETEHLDRDASQWAGFLQLSGLHVIYDVPALPGRRVYEVKLDDASELDLTDDGAVYTAAVPQSMLDGTYGYPVLSAGAPVGTLRELVARRVAAEGITQAPDDRRIILYGARQNEIIDYFSPLLIIFVILLFAVFGGHKWRRAANFER